MNYIYNEKKRKQKKGIIRTIHFISVPIINLDAISIFPDIRDKGLFDQVAFSS